MLKKIMAFVLGLMLVLAAGCGGSSGKASADSPEGAVQAYYNALKDGKPEVAYEYRTFNPPKTKEDFVKERNASTMPFKDFTVGKAVVNGNQAKVPVNFKTGSSAMAELTINITVQKDKSWKIISTNSGTNPSAGGGMPPAGSGMPPTGGEMPPTGSGMPPTGGEMPPASN